MDIIERKYWRGKRHPWEMSRVNFMLSLLKKHLDQMAHRNVLDVGCGDGYVLGRTIGAIDVSLGVGFDPELSDDLIRQLGKDGTPYTLVNRQSALQGNRFDLILLLDVLEHADDDLGLLASIVQDHLAPLGHMLITVPAFPFLFASHDVFLKHRRRYNLRQLLHVVCSSGLSVKRQGYFFFSPLLARMAEVCCCRGADTPGKHSDGVSNWNHGMVLSRLLEGYLNLENKVMYLFGEIGITIPGLSAYVLCEKRP